MDSPTNFPDILKYYQSLVWPKIESYLNNFSYFPEYCQIHSKYKPLLDLHLNMVKDYPERKGKYLRPALLLLTAESMGFPLKKAIKTAAAMQMSEEWILCHDDIEDDSMERRGKPTLHRLYGKELAINAGDNLQTIQWKILFDNQSILGPSKTNEIINEFYVMFNRTFLGQTIDIKWNQDRDIVLTDEDVFLTLESKTGYYTIAGPMRLGAILAGANNSQLNLVYKFGVMLGRVFQIVDDVLDITSDFSGLKKQQGNDIYENKKTILLVHLIRSAKNEDKLRLGLILAKNRDQKTPEEIKFVINLMEKYGSIYYAKKMAADFSQQAEKIFNHDLSFLSKQPFRDQIHQGIDFIVHRQH